jgi:tRNA threonylcarbamoyl adenosine modification protein (Sua5/YciO/YrdC/YwlC family)
LAHAWSHARFCREATQKIDIRVIDCAAAVLIPINPTYPEPRKVKRAVDALRDDAIIAYPTDATYALGCALSSKHAIDRLYVVKGMKRTQPLSLICPDLSDIARYALVDNQAYRLLRRLLPGPYTFILPATREVPRALLSKQKTVGLRVPAHPVPIAIVRELGCPLVTTTAGDPNGGEPLVDPDDIDARFGGLAMVIDAGLGGVEPTTVIDLVESRVVREGAGPVDDLF